MEEFLQRRCSDDVVTYSIYLDPVLADISVLIESLNDFKNKCLAFVLNETCNHIWQKQSFNLRLIEQSIVPHLHGSTNFGDSLEDEWLVVSLLIKLTELYPQLIATVTDADGQFLLIEAAEELPTWLTPDTCENRVFISLGVLHVLLQPSNPGQILYCPIGKPSLSNALHIVSSYPSYTKASEQIMLCIQKRTNKFNSKINSHFVNVYIPRTLAHLLDQFPCFISTCVEAFYLRDPIDLRSCRIFNYVPPVDRIWTQIPMTRYHYAQLKQQHFIPDKRSGYVVADGELLPKELKGFDLGMKIAHGCEISCSNYAKLSPSNINSFKTFSQENSFECFLRTLHNTGYFCGEIEGSKLFQKLLEQAKNFYRKSIEVCNHKDEILSNVFFLLKSWKTQSLPCFQNLSAKNNLCDLPQESSDKWMYLEKNDIDEITEKINKGFSGLYEEDQLGNKLSAKRTKEEQMREVVDGVHAFVDKNSDYSGAEVPDTTSVQIDSEAFIRHLEDILKVDRHGNPSNSSSLFEEDSDESISSDDEVQCNEYNEYINQLDDELDKTAVGESFLRNNKKTQFVFGDNSPDIDENTLIDLNLLENFLHGSTDEMGTSGPVSNLLGSMGVDLPDK